MADLMFNQDCGKLGLTFTVAVRPKRKWRLWLAAPFLRFGAWLIGSEVVYGTKGD